jgi:hypothetical protein
LTQLHQEPSSIERKRNSGTSSCGKPLEHRQKSDKIIRDDRQEPKNITGLEFGKRDASGRGYIQLMKV